MQYLCEARLVLDSSVKLRLTAEQLRRRAGQLVAAGGDLYSPVREVEFKAGEIVEIEGELPKALLPSVSLRGSRRTPEETSARKRKPAGE